MPGFFSRSTPAPKALGALSECDEPDTFIRPASHRLGKAPDRSRDAVRRFELDVVPDAVQELEPRAGNRVRELSGGFGRHEVALGPGHDRDRASDVPEERERIDGICGEDAAVPPEPPAAFGGLE